MSEALNETHFKIFMRGLMILFDFFISHIIPWQKQVTFPLLSHECSVKTLNHSHPKAGIIRILKNRPLPRVVVTLKLLKYTRKAYD